MSMEQLTVKIEKLVVKDYKPAIEKQLELLHKSDVSPANKKLITDFINFCEVGTNKVGESRRRMYLYELRILGELAKDKSFKEMQEADILELMSAIKKKKRCVCPMQRVSGGRKKRWQKVECGLKVCAGLGYSDSSVSEFYKIICKFWKWMYNCSKLERPEPIKRLDFRKTETEAEPVIHSEEDIKRIIDFQPTPMRKLFFAALFDFMARESEMLSRRVGHVGQKEGKWTLTIDATKTKKSHDETAFYSAPYFTTWMLAHPAPNNKQAPLFVVSRNGGKLTPMKYDVARAYYLQACKFLKIAPIKLHSFRAAGATYADRRGVSTASIERRGSWTKGSKELRTRYIRSDRETVDREMAEAYGLETESEKETEKTMKNCKNCRSGMNMTDKFCPKCGYGANAQAHYAKEEKDAAFEEMLEEKLKQKIDEYITQKLEVKK